MTPLDWPEVAPTLTDGSVSLRPWADDDADAVLAACQDPSIQRWLPVPVPYLAEHAVGFWVAPRARGQKVAQRAARLLCDWAMTDGGLARLELYVDPENLASRAVAERIGGVHEGVLRGKVVIHGARRDMSLYALVK